MMDRGLHEDVSWANPVLIWREELFGENDFHRVTDDRNACRINSDL